MPVPQFVGAFDGRKIFPAIVKKKAPIKSAHERKRNPEEIRPLVGAAFGKWALKIPAIVRSYLSWAKIRFSAKLLFGSTTHLRAFVAQNLNHSRVLGLNNYILFVLASHAGPVTYGVIGLI